MTRVAAVDCGTNSIRLLIADVDPAAGTLVDLERRLEIVRLGAGVDRTGRLDPRAVERTLAALAGYARLADRHRAERVRMVATSATRDAVDRSDFVGAARAILGVQPEVVSGAEEARLSYAGAVHDLPVVAAAPYLVVDIGGGSTELIRGDSRNPLAVRAGVSVDVGCVRLSERHLRDAPPSSAQVAAARAEISAALDAAAAAVTLDSTGTLVGLAGTVTTVAAIHLGLPAYDSTLIHHSRVSAQGVASITERLLTSTREQIAAMPVMHPGRVDVIAAGALVLHCVLERCGAAEVLVSEHDILDGIAWSLV